MFIAVLYATASTATLALPTTCAKANNCGSPDPPNPCNFASYLALHEGCCLCAYQDTKGLATVGIGFNLKASGAKARIESIGLNYDNVTAGKTCLTYDQVLQLFSKYSLPDAQTTTKTYISNWNSLCCGVQGALIDVAFAGSGTFAQFKNMRAGVESERWTYAALELEDSKWCDDVKERRCGDDYNALNQGCPCTTTTLPVRCSNHGNRCCANVKNSSAQVCCRYYDGTLDSDLPACCTDAYPTCCATTKTGGCCGTGYKHCCTQGPFCCKDDYPVCCGTDLANSFCCASGYRCGNIAQRECLKAPSSFLQENDTIQVPGVSASPRFNSGSILFP